MKLSSPLFGQEQFPILESFLHSLSSITLGVVFHLTSNETRLSHFSAFIFGSNDLGYPSKLITPQFLRSNAHSFPSKSFIEVNEGQLRR